MSRNGNGQYTLPAGNPVVTGTTITSDWANTTLGDIATALTGSVAADGQTPMSGTLDMSNNKITGLIDGTNPTDAATVRQINNPSITGGTINGAVIGNTNPKDGNFLALTANSGEFSASLTAPTITPATDESTNVATTQFVQNAIAAVSAGVITFNGRSGNVDLNSADVNNALGYTPYNAGTDTVVTSANYGTYTVGKTGLGASGTWGISISGNAASANNANTVDNITSAQVTGALGFIPLAPNSPALNGTPTAPTATTGTNTTQIATCAFVLANSGGGGGAVTSVNGKVGAVVLNAADVGAYASNNPAGYTTLTAVQAQGYTTQAWVQSQGYATTSQLATYVTTNTTQTITGAKTFAGALTSAYGGLQCQVTNNGLQMSTETGVGLAYFNASINTLTNGGAGWTVWKSQTYVQSSGDAKKPGGGAWADSSDIRLKSDIQTLTNCLDTITQLNPVQYLWKSGNTASPNIGFIAQEVEQVIPSAVIETTLNEGLIPGTNTPIDPIDYEQAQALRIEESIPADQPVKVKAIGWKNDFFAMLVGSIQDLNDKIIAQQAEIDALKAK